MAMKSAGKSGARVGFPIFPESGDSLAGSVYRGSAHVDSPRSGAREAKNTGSSGTLSGTASNAKSGDFGGRTA